MNQVVNAGDTAWVLVCGILVLMMTIPGLVLFYGGMVRSKDMLSIMMQSFAICIVVTLVWVLAGYSLAFSNGSAWIGGLSDLGLRDLASGWNGAFTLGAGGPRVMAMSIPQSAFVFFQMTFAIITPAVITGSFADRMKFSALLLFTISWTLLVYAPVAHWVWSPGGWLHVLGLGDYAGGTVVEINAGIAGLACAVMLGPRAGYGVKSMNGAVPSYAIIGACLLWVGWLGFDSGSAGGANGNAGMAVLVTQIAAAAAALSWGAVEWFRTGRASAAGVITGAVVGMVAITPAAGYVLPMAALGLGLGAGVVSFVAVTMVKRRLGYDDSLDVFGVHGIGGIVGTLAVGVCAYSPLSQGAITAGLHQFIVQAVGVVATVVYDGVVSLVLLKLIDLIVGIRVTPETELAGLDRDWRSEAL